MAEKRMVPVTSRAMGVTFYILKEFKDKPKIRREFAPGQTINIDIEELEALMYTAGGETLLRNYLRIDDKSALEHLSLSVEPEYNMSEKDVIELLTTGSVDALIDCLNFAPQGVLDLIKHHAVELPLADMNKIKPINKKMNFDVMKAIQNNQPETPATATAPATPVIPVAETVPVRRVVPAAQELVVPPLVK